MPDETEDVRRELQSEVNAVAASREELEREYGRVWDTDELTRDFDVLSFMAPFVAVRRKSDGARGALVFQHMPRFYFGFMVSP